MKMVFRALTLQCRQSREVIEFSPQVTYFHGQISAGKSSIMRLIDYCLGGNLEQTPAIRQELVSAELSATLGENEVLFERDVQSNLVQVTWQNSDGETGSVLAPLQVQTNAQPIWEGDVYTLSDLIFHLQGIRPIKVRKSKQRDDSPLVRLSFRDIMWYCYLDQDNLDSSFYRMEDQYRKLKSRDAMRFITGFYTERMNDLEIQLDEVISERYAKIEAVKQVRKFLRDFGYGEEVEIQASIAALNDELNQSLEQLDLIRQKHQTDTHFADDLRQQLRELSNRLANEEEALEDVKERIIEQESLKAEFLSAKFKLAKATSASSVLTGVRFTSCPSCGAKLLNGHSDDPDLCYLCGNVPGSSQDSSVPQADIVRQDLTSRIDDLAESIRQHTEALVKQERKVISLKGEKNVLDEQLNSELFDYDSAYLSTAREVERRIATLQERRISLQRSFQMLASIGQLEDEARSLREKQESLREGIEAERNKLGEADRRIRDIEDAYLDALKFIGVPGIQEGDTIEINRQTWMPWIVPQLDDEVDRNSAAYNFYNAGSGGKKTLLNVCYALAVHRVAIENKLYLPTFLMIDTPMKNIGEDVNKDIFHAFYSYLYRLAAGPMNECQFIIVDKEYFEPGEKIILEVNQRFMSPDMPLISYYRGP